MLWNRLCSQGDRIRWFIETSLHVSCFLPPALLRSGLVAVPVQAGRDQRREGLRANGRPRRTSSGRSNSPAQALLTDNARQARLHHLLLRYGMDSKDTGKVEDCAGICCASTVRHQKRFGRRNFSRPARAQVHGRRLVSGYAASTPITDGERLYVFFGKSGVYCFDLDGTQLWRPSSQEHERMGFGNVADSLQGSADRQRQCRERRTRGSRQMTARRSGVRRA